jgi:hypothetical protein
VVGFPPQRAYVQRPPIRSHQRNTLVTKAQAPRGPDHWLYVVTNSQTDFLRAGGNRIVS